MTPFCSQTCQQRTAQTSPNQTNRLPPPNRMVPTETYRRMTTTTTTTTTAVTSLKLGSSSSSSASTSALTRTHASAFAPTTYYPFCALSSLQQRHHIVVFPVEQCKKGHLYCKQCVDVLRIEAFIEHTADSPCCVVKKCTESLSVQNTSRNVALEQMLCMGGYPCEKHFTQGCKWIGSIYEKYTHEQECVLCPNRDRGCLWTGILTTQPSHEEICECRQMVCSFQIYGCTYECMASELAKHCQRCEFRQFECPTCDATYVLKGAYTTHVHKCSRGVNTSCADCNLSIREAAAYPRHDSGNTCTYPLGYNCGIPQDTSYKHIVVKELNYGLRLISHEIPFDCEHMKGFVKHSTALKHSSIWKKQPIPCVLCKHLCTRETIEQHLLTTCPQLRLQCPLCDEFNIVRKDMNAHLQHKCLHIYVTCQQCTRQKKRKDMDTLSADMCIECAFERIPCEHCLQVQVRNKMAMHLTNRCRKIPMACEHCTVTVMRDDMYAHNNYLCMESPSVHIRCEYCTLGRWRHSMQRHHENDCQFYPVQCQHCLQRMQRRRLQAHQATECKYLPDVCSLCNKWVSDQSMEEHLQLKCEWQFEHQSLLCSSCNMHVPSLTTMDHHVRALCPKQPIACNNCKKMIPREEMDVHCYRYGCGMKPSPTSTIKCVYGCNHSTKAHHMKAHVQLSCENVVSTCHACNLSVKRVQLQAHARNECLESSITCLLCDASGILRKDMQRHRKECMHMPVSCGMCNDPLLLLLRKDLDAHQQVCMNRVVSCQLCNAEGIARSHLEVHIHSACPECFVECDACQTLTRRKLLDAHQQMACPRTLVMCVLCKKEGGVPRCEMEHHIRLQCGAYPVQCNACMQVGILRKHLLTHMETECAFYHRNVAT